MFCQFHLAVPSSFSCFVSLSFAKKGTSILGFNLQRQHDQHRDEISLVAVAFYRLIISSIVKPSGFLFTMAVWWSGDGVDDFCDKSKIGSVDDDVTLCSSSDEFVWICMCVLRLARWLKLRLHTGHLWGDSSKCVTLCTARVRD